MSMSDGVGTTGKGYTTQTDVGSGSCETNVSELGKGLFDDESASVG